MPYHATPCYTTPTSRHATREPPLTVDNEITSACIARYWSVLSSSLDQLRRRTCLSLSPSPPPSHPLSLHLAFSLCRASESPSLSPDEHGVAWILTCAPKSPVTLSRRRRYTADTRSSNPPTSTSMSPHRLTRWRAPPSTDFLVERRGPSYIAGESEGEKKLWAA